MITSCSTSVAAFGLWLIRACVRGKLAWLVWGLACMATASAILDAVGCLYMYWELLMQGMRALVEIVVKLAVTDAPVISFSFRVPCDPYVLK